MSAHEGDGYPLRGRAGLLKGRSIGKETWTGLGVDIFSEYFIFSPSIRGLFGIGDEIIRDNDPNSPWTGNIQSMKSRGILINFTFH